MEKKSLITAMMFASLLSCLTGTVFAKHGPSRQKEVFGEDKVWTIARPEWVPGEIIVKFKDGVSEGAVQEINRQQGASVSSTSTHGKFKRISIPADRTVEDMVKTYRQNPNVEYAQANYICCAHQFPADPPKDHYYPDQWNFQLINMEPAWYIQPGGSAGIVVAVLDTGVAYETRSPYAQCPDLAGVNFVAGYDFINNDSHPNDDYAHGTHVTGTIAQTTNNDYGVAGIAFNTSIMPVKVLGADGYGTVQTLADGIRYAADHGAHIINMSLGFSSSVEPEDIPAVGSAVAYAHSKGCAMVASAGNDWGGIVSLPAAYDEVIAVGAVQSEDGRAGYSQYGTALELVAPGGDFVDRDMDGYMDGVLQQTFSKGNPKDFAFWYYAGTSMAAPHVSGLLALLMAQGVTAGEAREILHITSAKMGNDPGDKADPHYWDNEYGYGRVDALAALSVLAPGEVVEEFYSDAESLMELATPIDLRDKAGAQLTFWRWLRNGLSNGEYLAVDVHHDGVWEEIAFWTNLSGDTGHWLYENYNLHTLGALSNDFSVRFRTKDGTMGERVCVNSFRIVSYGSIDLTPPTITSISGNTSTTTGDPVDIFVTAQDDLDVTSAKIFIDQDSTGVAMVEGPDDTFAYTYTAPMDSLASHSYYVAVYDAGGNTSIEPAQPGTYTITVTDDDAPVAKAGTDKSVLVAEEVIFDGSGSIDNVGITGYSWEFGDGTSAAGTIVSHTYNATGTYTVTLTVNDSAGNVGSDTTQVGVTKVPANIMHVESIDLKFVDEYRSRRRAQATVLIKDSSGSPVPGTVVKGDWSGAYNMNGVSATTGSDGKVSFESGRGSGTFTFTVKDVSKAGWIYYPSQNKETSDSI